MTITDVCLAIPLYLSKITPLRPLLHRSILSLSWDANGNAIEGTLITPHSEALVYQEFDKQNRRTLLKMLTKADPPIEVRVALRYDREGRVVERRIREGYTPPQTLRYTYDKQGNNTAINDQKFRTYLQ